MKKSLAYGVRWVRPVRRQGRGRAPPCAPRAPPRKLSPSFPNMVFVQGRAVRRRAHPRESYSLKSRRGFRG
jgi:hypothetical protein